MATPWLTCCSNPVPSALLNNLLVFGRLLRSLGVDVHPGRLLDAVDALQHVDVGSRDDVYYTCRALLVHRHEHLPIYDKAFDAFWQAAQTFGPATRAATASEGERTHAAASAQQLMAIDDAAVDSGAPHELGMWSDAGGIADKEFGRLTPEEIRVARAALERLTWTPGTRRTRRWIPGGGPRLDLRRALARSHRTGGDMPVLPRSSRRIRPRPLVVLCDVSGSMERYSRMLLHFAHALGRRHESLEVFLFSTTLTRVTRELRSRDIDGAIAAVSRAVPHWSGGTRIGDALRQFHQRWARRVLHHGPVVLLVSDGWDRGDPLLLRDQIARLRRSCHRLIWLNPLIGTADYAPLTRGLQAALPYVHDFLPVRTMTDLFSLAAHLNALDLPARQYNRNR